MVGRRLLGNLCTSWGVLLVLIVVFLALDRPLIRGDGLAYLAWLDSIAGDLDLDLANQAQRFAHLNEYQIFFYAPTERHASAFPHGAALLHAPFYWLARLAYGAGLGHLNDFYFLEHQGLPFPYSFFAMVANNLMALGAALFAYRAGTRLGISSGAMAVACVALFLGSPLLYYSTIDPLNSHVPGTLLISLAVWLWIAHERDLRSWAAMGVVLGLAFLVRWQLALFMLPLAGVGLWGTQSELGGSRARRVAVLVAGFAAVAWHQSYVWWRLFGSPWVVPGQLLGRDAFLVGPRFIPQVLFSPSHGLIVWAPMAGLALLGLAVLYRRNPSLTVALGLMVILQILIASSVRDWWGGFAFGMRRLTELYPVLVLSLGALLQRMGEARHQLLRRAALSVPALLLAYSMVLFFSHLNYVATNLEHPEGNTAWEEIRYQFQDSDLGVTAQVIREHYGVWAWPMPGP